VYDIGMRLLRPGGKLIAYGVPDSGVHYDGTRWFFRGIRIMQKVEVLHPTIERMQKLLQEGRMDFTAFVTHHFPLEEVPEALRMALEEPGRCLAMVIDVDTA
jgi:L-iditol 2-dehydrogenase